MLSTNTMKKHNGKKLVVSTQTIKALQESDLTKLQGGLGGSLNAGQYGNSCGPCGTLHCQV